MHVAVNICHGVARLGWDLRWAGDRLDPTGLSLGARVGAWSLSMVAVVGVARSVGCPPRGRAIHGLVSYLTPGATSAN